MSPLVARIAKFCVVGFASLHVIDHSPLLQNFSGIANNQNKLLNLLIKKYSATTGEVVLSFAHSRFFAS